MSETLRRHREHRRFLREHRFSQKRLQSVMDDVLDEMTVRRVLMHVADCDDCCRDFGDWRDVRDCVARLGMALDPMALQRLREGLASLDGHGLAGGAQRT